MFFCNRANLQIQHGIDELFPPTVYMNMNAANDVYLKRKKVETKQFIILVTCFIISLLL